MNGHKFSSSPKGTPYKNNRVWKQEKALIVYFLAENFKSVGVSDIYLFFELSGDFWNGTRDWPSYKCRFFFLPSKVIHNCQTWRNKSHNKQNWYVSVIFNENCFSAGKGSTVWYFMFLELNLQTLFYKKKGHVYMLLSRQSLEYY